jgi:signal transduction histidine kinase
LHTQRLESVATLAGGVAHDLNNILTPMLMVTGVFHRKLTDPRDRELMAGVEAGAKRGAAIVRQLLVFSRSLAHERTTVDLAELVRETARLVREKNAGKIAVVESAEPELWPIRADLEQIRQVLASLCTNACEAMPQGGRLALRAENTRQSPRATTSNPWGKGGPCVMVTVMDTGTGIAPEVIGRIFDPFFTTKEIGRGSGLGLSSVHGIVTGHGGTVEVESQQGQGATFRVFLPAMVKRQSPAKPTQSEGAL